MTGQSLRDYVQHKLDCARSQAIGTPKPDCTCGLDALLSASPHDGWQTMETAPKDGSAVLITIEREQPNGTLRLVGEAYFHDPQDGDTFGDTGWWWANTSWGERGESRIDDAVIFWQPLPAPPVLPAPESER